MPTIHRTCADDGNRPLCDRGARDCPYGSCRRNATSSWGFGGVCGILAAGIGLSDGCGNPGRFRNSDRRWRGNGYGPRWDPGENSSRDGDPFLNGLPPIFLLFIWFCVLLGVCGTWLYYALLESSEWQGTAGKKALGLIVTDMQGRRVTFARASGRHFGKIVTSFIPLGIGYAMAGFTQKRQALHDILASCLVLRKG